MIKECREMQVLRTDVKLEEVNKQLWEFSEKQIEQKEKESAVKRVLAKKQKEAAEKKSGQGSAAAGEASNPDGNGNKSSAGSR